MKLIAIKHISDQLPEGSIFEQAQTTDANILIAAGLAKPYEEPSASASASPSGSDFKGPAGKPPAVRGQGSILEGAEPSNSAPSATSAQADAPAPRRGRHRRRDMRADESK